MTKFVQGANLTSGFSLKKTDETSSSISGGSTETSIFDMSPLVGIDGTLKKWPVTFKYQHTLHREATATGANPQSVARDGDNLDMSYEIQKSSTGLASIKLFKWSIPVRGHASLGVTFSKDQSVTTIAGSVTSNVSNLSLIPHLSYIFTDNVTGTLQYNYARATQDGAITTTNTASLIAEIKF